jgi:hypothetical protein
MPAKNFDNVDARYHYNGMTILSQLNVSLLREIARRQKHPKLSVPQARDEPTQV